MKHHARRSPGLVEALLITFASVAGGCSFGPQTLPRDRFDYGQAMARSSHEQLLTNIVRFRYMESPTFMSVTSVVNQYSLEGTLAANAQWGWGSSSFPDSALGIGAGGQFADRPTITYAPLVGQHFTESILTPIKPEAVLALIESGWRVSTLFPLTVHSVNGMRNRFFGGSLSQALDPRFKQMVDLMAQMQEDGTLSVRVIKAKDETKPSFAMMISGARSDPQKVSQLKTLLGVDPDADRYRIAFGSAARDANEIAIVTRSVLAILADMSSYVRVPEEHVAEGRAAPGAPIDDGMAHPMVIHSGTARPDDAYTSIRYRDHWYWIDDRDFRSKKTFAILQLLATLAESPDAAQTPLLTIPTG